MYIYALCTCTLLVICWYVGYGIYVSWSHPCSQSAMHAAYSMSENFTTLFISYDRQQAWESQWRQWQAVRWLIADVLVCFRFTQHAQWQLMFHRNWKITGRLRASWVRECIYTLSATKTAGGTQGAWKTSHLWFYLLELYWKLPNKPVNKPTSRFTLVLEFNRIHVYHVIVKTHDVRTWSNLRWYHSTLRSVLPSCVGL